MIRRLGWIIAVLFFGISILAISVYKATGGTKLSFAASSLKFIVQQPTGASEQPTPTPIPKSTYYLVYPGTLPDHPLYKLKMLRDQIWLGVTTDRIKKTELLLLFADKRIGAGEVLVNGNKIDLGLSTLTKGEKYFERAVSEARVAKENGRDVTVILGKFKAASIKYEEVLASLEEKVNTDGKVYLKSLGGTIKNLREESLTF